MTRTPSKETRQRLHAVVRGRVQGVNFRAATVRTAALLGLHGWVRNRLDGSVETVAEGTHLELERFVDFLHRGPSSAVVTDVAISWEPPTGEFADFRVR
jgi:acylphosphatase